MDIQRLSAILLIAAFAILVVAYLLGPKGIYQTPDLQRRVQIIENAKTRWNIAQSLIGLWILLTAAGFVLLAWHLRTVGSAWVPTLGAAAFVVGLIPAVIFLYNQTIDPLSSYEGTYSGMETLYYWLSLAGLLLFGIAFLQASMPTWLGYLTAGAALLYGVFYLISGTGFLVPGLVSILSLVTAIFMLRQ